MKVPGDYNMIKVKKMVAPAYLKRLAVPAQYHEVRKQVKVRNGKMEWRPVLCQTNVTPDIVRSLQEALQTASFDPGPIDGVLGRQTLAAVESYQQANSLPVGNLTLETLETLGVPIGDMPVNRRPEALFPAGDPPARPSLTPAPAPHMDSFNMNDPKESEPKESKQDTPVNMPDVPTNPNAPQDVKQP